jgi:hypothetical protein
MVVYFHAFLNLVIRDIGLVQFLSPTALPEEEGLQVHIEYPEGQSRLCRVGNNFSPERRIIFANDKWLSMNKQIAYRKTLRCTNKDQIRMLGKYLDKVKCKWFN